MKTREGPALARTPPDGGDPPSFRVIRPGVATVTSVVARISVAPGVPHRPGAASVAARASLTPGAPDRLDATSAVEVPDRVRCTVSARASVAPGVPHRLSAASVTTRISVAPGVPHRFDATSAVEVPGRARCTVSVRDPASTSNAVPVPVAATVSGTCSGGSRRPGEAASSAPFQRCVARPAPVRVPGDPGSAGSGHPGVVANRVDPERRGVRGGCAGGGERMASGRDPSVPAGRKKEVASVAVPAGRKEGAAFVAVPASRKEEAASVAVPAGRKEEAASVAVREDPGSGMSRETPPDSRNQPPRIVRTIALSRFAAAI